MSRNEDQRKAARRRSSPARREPAAHEDVTIEEDKEKVVPLRSSSTARPPPMPRPSAPPRRPPTEPSAPSGSHSGADFPWPIDEAPERPAPYWLVVKSGPGRGKSIPIPEGELTIGRSSANTFKLPHPSVSRRHATIIRHGGRVFIQDGGSHNGTFVNGDKVQGRVELKPGAQIVLGLVTLAIRGEQVTGEHEGVPLSERSGFKLAVFGVAAGLGLTCVLLVAAFGTRTREPAVAPVEAPPTKATPRTAEVKPPTGARPLPRVNREENPSEHISLVTDGPAAVPSAPPDPPVVRATPTARETREPRETPREPRESRPSAKASRASPSTDGAAALELYQIGALDAAIASARNEGNGKLATKIAEVKKAYATAKADLSFGEDASAMQNLQRALAVDAEISDGQGRTAQAIRAQLAKLYLNQGLLAYDKGDQVKAMLQLERVLKYDPGNQRAAEFLRKLKAANRSKPVDTRRAADQAFGD